MSLRGRRRAIGALVACALAGMAVVLSYQALVVRGPCGAQETPTVSYVRGVVVGRSLGVLQYRWLRRLFAADGARLQLVSHQVPYRAGDPYQFIAERTADDRGRFDFGDVPPGNYALRVALGPDEAGAMLHFTVAEAPPDSELLVDASPAPYCECCGWDIERRPAGDRR